MVGFCDFNPVVFGWGWGGCAVIGSVKVDYSVEEGLGESDIGHQVGQVQAEL